MADQQRSTPPAPGDGGPGAPLHAERLWPSPAAWLLVLVAAGFGAATGLVAGSLWALVGALVLACAVAGWLVSMSVRVELGADGVLRVDTASIAAEHLTGAVGARGLEARALRGPLLDGRTHLCVRGWVDPVVVVGLGDPEDPTPTWLFSTRHPEAVVAALARVGVSGPVAVHVAPRSEAEVPLHPRVDPQRAGRLHPQLEPRWDPHLLVPLDDVEGLGARRSAALDPGPQGPGPERDAG